MKTLKEKLKDAICCNDIEFLITHKKKYDINERFKEEDNDTLLLYSISYAKSEAYQFFISNGANLNLVNNLGETIVHAMVYSGDLKRIQNVLKSFNMIDIDKQSLDGATPLLLSISLEKYDIAKFLLNNGANVNIFDNEGLGPIHLAAESDDLELVQLIVKNGADLTIKTNKGNRPLALCVNNSESAEIIRYLFYSIYGSKL